MIEYLSSDWMGLRWTAWMPLMAAHPLALAQLPSSAGLYRIRHAGTVNELLWIGWEPRGVRETMERLSRQVHLPLEPYNDPHVPARTLWTLRRTGVAFRVSGAPYPHMDAEGQQKLEAARAAYGAERALFQP